MEPRLILPAIVLSLTLLPTSPSQADPACDAEIAAIQAELDTPDEGVSAENIEKAKQLLKVLSEDCDGGTPFEVVAPIAQQIRSLLEMGGAS